MYVVEILWLIICHRAPGVAQEADPSERAFAWPLGNCESEERYVGVCSSLFSAVNACIFRAPKRKSCGTEPQAETLLVRPSRFPRGYTHTKPVEWSYEQPRGRDAWVTQTLCPPRGGCENSMRKTAVNRRLNIHQARKAQKGIKHLRLGPKSLSVGSRCSASYGSG